MGENRNTERVGGTEGRKQSEDLRINDRIIVKCTLKISMGT
jgi:hypothetical protein